MDIDHEIREVLDEYKDLEAEVRQGGLKELGTAKKNYLNTLLNIKKARVDAISKQIMNAKDANEINMIIQDFKNEIERIKEGMKDDAGTKLKRPKVNPYSSSK